MSFTKPVRLLFLFEVAINTFSGPAMILAPQTIMRDLLIASDSSEPLADEAAEACRWFGCMIFAFGAVQLYRALNSDPATLKLTLESFLVGDVLYTSASSYWALRKGIWTFAAIFNVGFSAVLGLARICAISDVRLAMPSPKRATA